MTEPVREPILYSGQIREVVFAVRSDGRCPGHLFFNDLDDREKAKILAIVQRLATSREPLRGSLFKPLERGLFEIKTHRVRMPCFFRGNTLVITQGFFKQRDRMPASELDRAKTIMSEYLAKKR